jgi:hypothetical protein
MRRVEAIVKSLAREERKLFHKLDKLAEAHRGTDVRLKALSENIDRFVRGRGGNGRGVRKQ